MIEKPEINHLSRSYGQPEFREQDINADKYLFESRSYRARSRRGEVVMVIEREPDQVLVHSKTWYEPPVMRLLTGGIELDESVQQALCRELEQETGYELRHAIFLALHRCHIHYQAQVMQFDSCIFWLEAPLHEPVHRNSSEAIQLFKWLRIGELRDIAADLRATPPPRQAWGKWRALSHEFTLELMDA